MASSVNKTKLVLGNKYTLFKLMLGNKLFSSYRRARLKSADFSIISNNCTAGSMYQKLGLRYTSPTIGLFICSDDYIKFLENFEHNIQQPLRFKKTSRHPKSNKILETKHYPLGVLGDDVEIHFLHYKDETEAVEKWNRRSKRINYGNLFFTYSDVEEGFQEEFLQRFKNLQFKHKVFFSSKPSADHELVAFVDRHVKNPEAITTERYAKHFDLIKWLNGDKDFIKPKY